MKIIGKVRRRATEWLGAQTLLFRIIELQIGTLPITQQRKLAMSYFTPTAMAFTKIALKIDHTLFIVHYIPPCIQFLN